MNRSAILAALALLLVAVVDGQPIYNNLDRPVDVTAVIAPLDDYGGELPAALRNPYFFEGRPSFIEGRPSFIEGQPSFIERRPYILEERPLFVQVARPVLVVRRPVQVVVRPIQHTLYQHVPHTIVVQEQADDIKRPQAVYYSQVHDSVHPSYTQAEQPEEFQQTLPDSSHVPELIHEDPHQKYSPVVMEEPQETPNQVQSVLHHVPETETETIVKPQETTEFHQQEVVPDGATVEPELPSRVQISDTLTKFPESTEIVVDTTTSPEPLEKVIMVESSPATPTTDEITLTNGSVDKVDAHQPENIPVVETADNYELPTSQYAGNHQGGGSVGLGVQGNAGPGFQGNAVFGGGLNGGLGLQGNGGFGGGLNGGLGLQGNGGFGGGLNGGLGLQGNGGFGGGLNGGLGLQGNGGFGGGLNGGLGLQGNGGFGGGLNGGVSGALNKGAGVLGNFGTGANGGALFGGNIGAGIGAPGSAGFGGFANIFG